MLDTTIRKSVFLRTPPPRLWDYLTRADLLEKWFHPAERDLVEGEDYTLLDHIEGNRMCWGTVEKCTPHSYMRWSFTVGPMNGAMSVVEWRLEPAPGGTQLTLEHSGLPTDLAGYGLVVALDEGWHGFVGNLHIHSAAEAKEAAETNA